MGAGLGAEFGVARVPHCEPRMFVVGGGEGGGKQTQGIKQKAWGGQGCAEQPRVFPEHGERRGGGGGGGFVPSPFCFCGGIRARRFDRCLPLMVACTATKIGVKHFLGGKMVFWHNRN